MSRKGIILSVVRDPDFIRKFKLPAAFTIFDKPMIYYSLSTIMLAGIQEILLISTPQDIQNYKNLLGDGKSWGIKIEYATQNHPDGLAQAMIISEEFLDGNDSVLVLGDNIFYGSNFEKILTEASSKKNGATIFAYSRKSVNLVS